MAGCSPAALIVEIMNEDGTMARRAELTRFAKTHGLKMLSIAQLISYRMRSALRDLGRALGLDGDQVNRLYGKSVADPPLLRHEALDGDPSTFWSAADPRIGAELAAGRLPATSAELRALAPHGGAPRH